DRLAALRVPSRIVQAKLQPGSAAAARARASRYQLLFQACREAGCADLLTAHHADDQAETVRMREGAGSGGRGLSGMAAISYGEAARLVRPFLGIPAARLRATLREAGVCWEEDPTNRDLRTLRAWLRATGQAGITADALRRSVAHGLVRREREREAAAALSEVALFPEGYAIAPASLGADALAALVWTLSGQPYPPAPVGGLASRTIHGVEIRPAGRLGRGWLLAREPEAAGPPVGARDGAVWDRRFRLAGDPGPGLSLGALGPDAARLRRHSPLPSVVLRTIPALRRGGEVVAVPHLGFPDSATCRNIDVWFCPARPAAGSPFRPAIASRGEAPGGA
ncbi:MAG: tRNA lysidine(34) synthetase TilS, partial [Acetobacteraceae bacterium]|nr:tRNA lysidine(34) synthetase TilS [Acetobacteraceae bacterium]